MRKITATTVFSLALAAGGAHAYEHTSNGKGIDCDGSALIVSSKACRAKVIGIKVEDTGTFSESGKRILNQVRIYSNPECLDGTIQYSLGVTGDFSKSEALPVDGGITVSVYDSGSLGAYTPEDAKAGYVARENAEMVEHIEYRPEPKMAAARLQQMQKEVASLLGAADVVYDSAAHLVKVNLAGSAGRISLSYANMDLSPGTRVAGRFQQLPLRFAPASGLEAIDGTGSLSCGVRHDPAE